MIKLKTIRWKNLLSTGNSFTEINLDQDSNTLIVGKNGSGKSSLIDALTFSLFGKPFRKITKPRLVNSINKKDCLVEIEFEENNRQYKVSRGIKPNIFEIYCDGICLNQDSTTRDYQSYLEKFILKMNYKSFTQIVILGSASYTPFMQLTPADRREVIEDLLDIQVFSVMNSITKQRLISNKEKLDQNKIELSGKDDKKLYIEKNITSLQKNSTNKTDKLKDELDHCEALIKETFVQLVDLENTKTKLEYDLEKISKLKPRETHKKLLGFKAKIETKQSLVSSDYRFFQDNDDCPTCKQSIEKSIKDQSMRKLEETSEKYSEALVDLQNEINKVIEDVNEVDILNKELTKVSNAIVLGEAKMESYKKLKGSVEKRINQDTNTDDVLVFNQKELKNISNEIEVLDEEKQRLFTERQYIETAISLLKDGGIKTKIIKQYLPIINKQINKYLSQMGFFCNFELDENFEETIKSRFRDDFSYNNFSEGEKFRLDLAILLAWRSVAKMKNSVNTNLLIFDEIFDSSLDVDGTDEFLKIMLDISSDTNCFVISHKTDQLIDKFQKVIRFDKRQNFSKMVE